MGSWEVGLVLGLQVCGKVTKICRALHVTNKLFSSSRLAVKHPKLKVKSSKVYSCWQNIDAEAVTDAFEQHVA